MDEPDSAPPVRSSQDVSPPPTECSRRSTVGGLRLVGACTLLSRVLGMARDMAMAVVFGAGPVMDAFSVAFRLPNLARRLFGEGALTSAFLPAFVRELNRSDRESARRGATAVFAVLAILLTGLTLIVEAALLSALMFANLSSETRLLLELTAILTPYVIVICLAAQTSAVLHALQHFAWPALLPVLLNVGWLASIALARWWWIEPEAQVRFICWGLLAAGVVQMIVPLLVLRRLGFPLARGWRTGLPLVREVFGVMVPIVAGLSVMQINVILDSLLAWSFSLPAEGSAPTGDAFLPAFLESGTASALYFGQRIFQFPLGVFGVALGTVLFPVLAAHVERGDMHRVREDLTAGLRMTISIGLPAGVGLMLLARPITALLFQHGRFDDADARLTSAVVVAYAGGVWASIALLIVHRGFYALGDRVTPLRIGLWAVAINIVLNFALLRPLGGVGLALATTIATTAQAVMAAVQLHRRRAALDWRSIGIAAGKTLVATTVMAAACLPAAMWFPVGESLTSRGLAIGAPIMVGGAAFLLACLIIRLPEPWQIFIGR